MENIKEATFSPPIVLDSFHQVNNENLMIYKIYNSLYVDSNIGYIYLPEYITDEDDIYTMEDILIDLLPL